MMTGVRTFRRRRSSIHAEAIEAGKHEVDNGRVVRFFERQRQGAGTRCRRVDGKARLFESLGDK